MKLKYPGSITPLGASEEQISNIHARFCVVLHFLRHSLSFRGYSRIILFAYFRVISSKHLVSGRNIYLILFQTSTPSDLSAGAALSEALVTIEPSFFTPSWFAGEEQTPSHFNIHLFSCLQEFYTRKNVPSKTWTLCWIWCSTTTGDWDLDCGEIDPLHHCHHRDHHNKCWSPPVTHLLFVPGQLYLKQCAAAPLLICFRQNLSEVTASGSLEIPDLSGEVGAEALTR